MEKMEFHLDSFDGPLDLLLHLISKNKVSIYDIPIAEILEQYMAVLREAETMDMDVAGDFIAMAAQLVYIKSRMLLPKREETPEEDDPRTELVDMLLEYQRFRQATAFFREKGEEGAGYADPAAGNARKRAARGARRYDGAGPRPRTVCCAAYRAGCRGGEPPFPASSDREPVPVEGRIRAILRRFAHAVRLPFVRLFESARSRSEIVATFLAVLELSKTHRITLHGEGENLELTLNDETGRESRDTTGEHA